MARTISLEESGDPGSIDESNLADGLNATTGILLVSAMFPLTKSKHSVEDYISWFSMFLGPITTDIYFYTPPVFSPNIQKARGEGLPITLNTSYASPFDIPPLMGLEEKYQKMHKNDRDVSSLSRAVCRLECQAVLSRLCVRNSAKAREGLRLCVLDRCWKLS